MIEDKYNYSSTKTTVVMVVANLGAVIGSSATGYYSQILGKRFLIVVMCLVSGALLYPYTFVSGPGLYAAAFFLQFCIGGAWGVIPIHLIELSPPAFKTFVVGTSYNLGVLVSSSSITILTTLGQRYPLPPKTDIVTGETIERFDYSIVMCIFGACVITYVIIVTILGPERLESGEVDTEAEAGNDQDMGDDKFCITG
jgi:SHS family lactate transporter-like MFS transporter